MEKNYQKKSDSTISIKGFKGFSYLDNIGTAALYSANEQLLLEE